MITETQLIDFVLDNLSHADRNHIERALQRSPELRRQLIAVEGLLNQTALALPPRTPSTGLRQRISSASAAGRCYSGFTQRLARLFDLDTGQVRVLLENVEKLGQAPWVDSGIEGIRFLHLAGGPRCMDADCGFVHLQSGCEFPLHRHNGDEWSLILQGQLQDSSGTIFVAGDLAYQEPGSAHSYKSIGEEDLLFAVALYQGFEFVTDA